MIQDQKNKLTLSHPDYGIFVIAARQAKTQSKGVGDRSTHNCKYGNAIQALWVPANMAWGAELSGEGSHNGPFYVSQGLWNSARKHVYVINFILYFKGYCHGALGRE